MEVGGLFTLLSFSVSMGIASYLAGWLPLSFSLSQKQSRIISAIGSGLLIGTCLIIIIPEGIGTLYSAQENDISEDLSPILDDDDDEDVLTARLVRRSLGRRHEFQHQHHDPHAWVGMSLVAGFIMMYLIDQLPKHAAKVSFRRKPLQVSLADLSLGLRGSSQTARADVDESSDTDETSAKSFATTVGLVIHAAADGIALAASTFIAQTSVSFVVFLALMVHKAPAAFGLTSVLLQQGLTKRQARGHLIVFSLAAPVGAILTWLLVVIVSGGEIDSESRTKFWTGLLLIFSGGTFLYVAMHTMQGGDHDMHDDTSNGYGNGHEFSVGRPSKSEGQALNLRDTLLAVVGMVLPVLAQLGHAH